MRSKSSLPIPFYTKITVQVTCVIDTFVVLTGQMGIQECGRAQ